jgi:hypothetical protein
MENKLYKIKSSKLWIFFNLIIFNNKMYKFINNKYLIFEIKNKYRIFEENYLNKSE